MDEVLQYVRLRYSQDSDIGQIKNAVRLMETLYFRSTFFAWPPRKRKEEYKIAQDLAFLREIVLFPKPNLILEKKDIKSELISQKLNEKKVWGELSEGEIKLIEKEIIEPYDYYTTGVFLVDVMIKKRREYTLQILITIFLGILASFATISAALLSAGLLMR